MQSVGDDIRKSILPLPSQEPSAVLFNLLGLLIESTQDVTSIQDMMMGKNPGQNQPYSTSREVLEQGLKVFNGIYKRVYRSLTREAELIFLANRKDLDQDMYLQVLESIDPQANPQIDFDPFAISVVPTAEPDMVDQVDAIMKSEGLFAKLAAGMPLNVHEVTRRVLEAQGYEGIEQLMDVQPTPNPEIVLEEQKLAWQKEKEARELNIKYLEARDSALKDRANAIATIKKIEIEQGKADLDGVVAILDKINEERGLVIDEMKVEVDRIKANKPTSSSSSD